MKIDLKAIQAKGLPHATFADVFTVNEGETADPAIVAELDKYLAHFTPGPCPGCGAPLTGDLIHQFIGAATFTWGLAHGEGFCSKCKYPARAYHRDIGPIVRFEKVLAYHPDELREREEEAA